VGRRASFKGRGVGGFLSRKEGGKLRKMKLNGGGGGARGNEKREGVVGWAGINRSRGGWSAGKNRRGGVEYILSRYNYF